MPLDPDKTVHRTSHDLETRGDGRTVYGIAIPYDREAKVDDGWGQYIEVIRRGAFAKSIQSRSRSFKLCVNHDKMRKLPVGSAQVLREEAAGLYGEFRISQTADGNDALTLIRDGVVDAFSVGMIPVKDREPKPGYVERTELKLTEVSLVAFPAYEDALIAGIRHALDPDELHRLKELIRNDPGLLDELARAINEEAPTTGEDTPTEGAVEPVEDDGSEPAEATRDDEPLTPEHSTQEPIPVSVSAERVRRIAELKRDYMAAISLRSERYDL